MFAICMEWDFDTCHFIPTIVWEDLTDEEGTLNGLSFCVFFFRLAFYWGAERSE